MPDDDRVGAHRLQGQRGVLEALALGDAGALGGEVDDVGGQPLGRRLERDPGAGGVLEEEVDHGAAAQRRQLLDRPVGEPGQLLGGVEDEERVVVGRGRRRRAGGGFIGPPPCRRSRLDASRCPRRRSPSSRTCTRSASEVGQVLADVVGADRQLAVAAVDQDRELHRARAGRGRRARRGRPGRCGRRRARRRRGRRCGRRCPPAGARCAPSARAGVQPQVVAVHGDVERADRDVGCPRRRRSGRPAGGRAGRRGSGCRAGPGRRRPWSARGSRGRSGSRARPMSGASRTGVRRRCAGVRWDG